MRIKSILWVFPVLLILTSCQNNDTTTSDRDQAVLTEAETKAYLERGKSIATATFAALSGQLQSALQEGGVAHAIGYCNTVAYPLVDSLSEVHQAQIRRTSEQVRNPKDAPLPREEVQLASYAQQMQSGEDLRPVVRPIDEDRIAFYAPITMQPLCLACHGKVGETLAEADYQLIREKYPEDEAVGYQAGDLRGMWSITFARD